VYESGLIKCEASRDTDWLGTLLVTTCLITLDIFRTPVRRVVSMLATITTAMKVSIVKAVDPV
jgi:hypothetical protein